MDKGTFIAELFIQHSKKANLPSPVLIERFIESLLAILFPAYSNKTFLSEDQLQLDLDKNKRALKELLMYVEAGLNGSVDDVLEDFYNHLPLIYKQILNDAEAIEKGDPAAKSAEEVMRSYPGFYAISIYRISHKLQKQGVPFIPRIFTEFAHGRTGIDIHPGAAIGESFFIDHGTGIVIGETTVIGKNVKIYQGVTLGALSVRKEMAETKRHPTIEDNVVIYAGATILGGRTVIGRNSTIGGNVWLTESVEENSLVYHQPETIIQKMK
jgi:serine O-acetyltransferase